MDIQAISVYEDFHHILVGFAVVATEIVRWTTKKSKYALNKQGLLLELLQGSSVKKPSECILYVSRVVCFK